MFSFIFLFIFILEIFKFNIKFIGLHVGYIDLVVNLQKKKKCERE
jgi:hypothetical protein